MGLQYSNSRNSGLRKKEPQDRLSLRRNSSGSPKLRRDKNTDTRRIKPVAPVTITDLNTTQLLVRLP